MGSRLHRRATTCHLCGEPIIWALTAAGHRQPLDPTPCEDGNVLAYKDALGAMRSRALSTAGDRSTWHPLERIYMPHQATCRLKLENPPADLPANVTPLRRRKR